jgi:hypothetical protein
MAKSTSGRLKTRVNNLFKDKPITIKNEDNLVTVNGTKICRIDSYWQTDGEAFVYKKSAVGWLISKINGDTATAKEILDMDNKVSKVNDDIFWYNVQSKRAKSIHKEQLFQARLSESLPLLERRNKQLNQKLKTVKMT